MLKRIIVFVVVFFLAQLLLPAMLGIYGGIGLLLSLAAAGFVTWKFGGGSTLTSATAPKGEKKPRLSDVAEVQGVEPVRGVWEEVYWKYWQMGKVFKCTGDKLQAVGIYVTSEALYDFSENKETWEEAKADSLSPSCPFAAKVSLAEVQSVEMESASQFHGKAARDEYVEPKMGEKSRLKERHPSLHWDRHGFFDSNTRQTIVYVFTKEGDRIRLFQTWNRDLAVKWRTQVSNRIEAALHAAPAIAKPKDGEPDYM